jgi:hypothetical protein
MNDRLPHGVPPLRTKRRRTTEEQQIVDGLANAYIIDDPRSSRIVDWPVPASDLSTAPPNFVLQLKSSESI